MNLQEVDFSKTLNDDQVFDTIMNNYSNLSKSWIIHQWNWLNHIYSPFNDHYKYMIIISLVEKTLQFYNQININYSYDEYYSKPYIHIESFSISELCEKLNLPKETVRRKVLELENEGVIKRSKRKITIDRKAFIFVKPINQIKITSKYIYLVSRNLNMDKLYFKKIDVKSIEDLIKNKFTMCWRWFYKMQIPIFIGFKEFMGDLISTHIWGTICMNQVYNVSKNLHTNKEAIPFDYHKTSDFIINNIGSTSGLSAMSISDMTNIPRATVIRKCKSLIKMDLLKINEKKQYVLASMNFKKILPYQTKIFRYKAKFIRKILNLLVIS